MDDRVEQFMGEKQALEKTPAIGLSIQHQVGEDRSIVFQGFVPADCTSAEMNDLLDKSFKASERQKARVEMPKLRKRLVHLEKVHKRVAEDMFRLDAEAAEADARAQQSALASGRRNPTKSAQQASHEQKNRADRLNAETTYKRHEEDISDLKAEIAELEKTIAED